MDKPTVLNTPRPKVHHQKRGKNKNGAPLQARERGIDTGTYEGAMQVSADKPLTQMQLNFVKLWASGESISTAAARAGYADAQFAYRLVRMPNILRIYEREKKAYEAAAGMTRKKVMEGFQEGIAMAILLGEPASIIAGWREVGRMCGYYEPVKVQHTVTHEGKIVIDRLNRMSDDDLLAYIAEKAESIEQGAPVLELVDGTDPS